MSKIFCTLQYPYCSHISDWMKWKKFISGFRLILTKTANKLHIAIYHAFYHSCHRYFVFTFNRFSLPACYRVALVENGFKSINQAHVCAYTACRCNEETIPVSVCLKLVDCKIGCKMKFAYF